MGTRALIHVKEKGRHSKTICTIYTQYDGYPRGIGNRVLDFIDDRRLSNGLKENCFNGMEELAAMLVAHLKTEAGTIYLFPPDSQEVYEEYTYYLYTSTNDIGFDETKPIYFDVDYPVGVIVSDEE